MEVGTRKIHVEACNINLQGNNGDFLFLPLNCMKEDRNIKHVTLQEHRRSTDWQHFSFAANFETKKVVAQWKNFEAAKDMLLNQTTTPWAQAVAHWRHVLDFFFFFLHLCNRHQTLQRPPPPPSYLQRFPGGLARPGADRGGRSAVKFSPPRQSWKVWRRRREVIEQQHVCQIPFLLLNKRGRGKNRLRQPNPFDGIISAQLREKKTANCTTSCLPKGETLHLHLKRLFLTPGAANGRNPQVERNS